MMKRLFAFAVLALVASVSAQNVNIGTKNTTLKDAGVAKFANSTFCLQETAGSDLACMNAPSLGSSTVLTLPATTGTLALTGAAVTCAQMPALTGDATSSAGACGTTLATVNSNVGSFTNASITVNAKGLITAASTGSSVSAAGSTTQLQFNDAGVLGASSTLTWNKTTLQLGVGVASPWSQLANTASNLIASDTVGVSAVTTTSGLTWAVNDDGFVAGFYNAKNAAGAEGLAVKILNTGSTTLILDVSSGAAQGTAGTQRFGVYGDGTVKIPSLTSTRVLFAGTGGLVSGSAGLLYLGQALSGGLSIVMNTTAGSLGGEGLSITNSGATSDAGIRFSTPAYTANRFQLFVSNSGGRMTIGRDALADYFHVLGAAGSGSLAGNVGIGQSNPTSKLHIAAGAATAGSAPIKLTSGTNNTTAEAGAMEYNGTNLFFTRAGTTRDNILTVESVQTTTATLPNRTLKVNVNGTTYYVHAKLTDD